MNSLPQEIFYQITSYLSLDDKKSLRNCSLVARSWRRASQRRLFESVKIPLGNLGSWLRGGVFGFSGYTRQLTCYKEKGATPWPTEESLGKRSDFKLEHLTLCSAYVLSLDRINLFSVFKQSLSGITLSKCDVKKSVLVSLIEYFPRLERLCLEELLCGDPYEETHVSLSRDPLKKLRINKGPGGSLELLQELTKLGLRSDEVALGPSFPSHAQAALTNCLIHAFGASAKCLRLLRIPSGTCGPSYPCCRDPS